MEKSLSESKYSPALTAEIRQQNISSIIRSYRQQMRDGGGWKLELQDANKLERAIAEYLEYCELHSILPSVLGFCSVNRISRTWFYNFKNRNAETRVGELCESLQHICASIRISATDRGVASEYFSKFLLLNTDIGYRDKIEFAPTTADNPLQNLDAEQARKRIMDAIPMEDD